MADNPANIAGNAQTNGVAHRLVYLVPEDRVGLHDTAVDLVWVRRVLWASRFMILLVAAAFGAAALTYGVLAKPWYRAEATLAPSERGSSGGIASQLSQLGGLASLAGISIGAPKPGNSLAILQSQSFARRFIEKRALLPVLFARDWDPELKTWRVPQADIPDERDAVRFFTKKVLRVSDDKKTGLVHLSVDWTDAAQAASWANELSALINVETRSDALAEAERNIAFLRRELEQTNVVSLQQAIGRLLEAELQKYMLARGADDFSYRVIDPAAIPKKRIRPKRALIVLVGLLGGALLASALVLFRGRASRQFG